MSKVKSCADGTMTDKDISIIEKYLKRDLNRPKTNIFTAFIYFLIQSLFAIFSTFVICLSKDIITISSSNGTLVNFAAGYVWNDIIHIFLLCFLVICTITLRLTLIGIVRLYQHYACETMRRRCQCMPSCSEYMILAIKKYGPIVGTWKGIKRLVKTCDGVWYKIGYP